MRAIFKPTNYTFEFRDEFFVEVQMDDGTCTCIAALADFNDAKTLAQTKLQQHGIKAVYVFTRTHQHLSLHKRDLAEAA